MRDFPITFLFLISREKELDVVSKNLQNLEGMPWEHNAVLAFDNSFDYLVLSEEMKKIFAIYSPLQGDFSSYKNTILNYSAVVAIYLHL